MKWSHLISVVVVACAVAGTPACSQGEPPAAKPVSAAVPEELRAGEAKFNANCSACHGVGGVGTTQGPPFLNNIYEPNHHTDEAFRRAAANGVKAHHWQFGNMPKIEGATPDDVEQIIKYVRWVQHQAGIF